MPLGSALLSGPVMFTHIPLPVRFTILIFSSAAKEKNGFIYGSLGRLFHRRLRARGMAGRPAKHTPTLLWSTYSARVVNPTCARVPQHYFHLTAPPHARVIGRPAGWQPNGGEAA